MSKYLKDITGFETYTELHDKIEVKEGKSQFGNVTVFIGPESERTIFAVQVEFISLRTGDSYKIFAASDSKDLDAWKVVEVLQNLLSGNFDYTDKYDKKVSGRLKKDIQGTSELLTVHYNDNCVLLKSFVDDFIKKNF